MTSTETPRPGRPLDLRVYLVTSGEGPQVTRAAAACARAGIGMVQVRHKTLPDTALLDLVLDVAEAVAEARPATRVVVDDRVEVALAAMRAGAHVHGVHLGQDDMPPARARALLGRDAIIGVTTGTLELVRATAPVAHLVDYVGAGPFRRTPTKDSGRPPLGLAGYPALVGATDLPVVAIGDVRADDVEALAATGVAGVAMVRELMESPDPGARARAALAAYDAGRAEVATARVGEVISRERQGRAGGLGLLDRLERPGG